MCLATLLWPLSPVKTKGKEFKKIRVHLKRKNDGSNREKKELREVGDFNKKTLDLCSYVSLTSTTAPPVNQSNNCTHTQKKRGVLSNRPFTERETQATLGLPVRKEMNMCISVPKRS